jgi:hypothetical protein
MVRVLRTLPTPHRLSLIRTPIGYRVKQRSKGKKGKNMQSSEGQLLCRDQMDKNYARIRMQQARRTRSCRTILMPWSGSSMPSSIMHRSSGQQLCKDKDDIYSKIKRTQSMQNLDRQKWCGDPVDKKHVQEENN